MLTVSTVRGVVSMLPVSTSKDTLDDRQEDHDEHDSTRWPDDRRGTARDGGLPHRYADQPAVEDPAVAAGGHRDAPDAPGAGRPSGPRPARPPDLRQRAHSAHRAVLAQRRRPRQLRPRPGS